MSLREILDHREVVTQVVGDFVPNLSKTASIERCESRSSRVDQEVTRISWFQRSVLLQEYFFNIHPLKTYTIRTPTFATSDVS